MRCECKSNAKRKSTPEKFRSALLISTHFFSTSFLEVDSVPEMQSPRNTRLPRRARVGHNEAASELVPTAGVAQSQQPRDTLVEQRVDLVTLEEAARATNKT